MLRPTQRIPGSLRGSLALLAIAATTAVIFARWAVNDWRAFELWDSSIFLYIGEQLRHGAVLYEDVWDSKPPIIFLVNALGLALTQGSPSGVFLLDALLVFASFTILWRSLLNVFQPLLAIFGVLFGLLLFHSVVAQPNATEVVLLPFQALSFALLIRGLEDGFRPTHAALQGCMAAVLFGTRANGVGIVVVYLVVLICVVLPLRGARCTAISVSLFSAAMAGVSLAIAYPFVRHSSWHSLYYASIGYNTQYAGLTPLYEKLHTGVWFFLLLAQNGATALALAGAIYIVMSRPSRRDLRTQVMWMSVLWLGVEVCFAIATGKRYGKNVIPWLLPLSLLATGFLDSLVHRYDSREPVPTRALGVLSMAVVLLIGFGSVAEWRGNQKASPEADEQVIPVAHRFMRPGSRVLFWGNVSARVVYRTGGPSGSRFFTSIPLLHGQLLYRALAPQALADVEKHRPELIVEKVSGLFPPLLGVDMASADPPGGSWDTAELLRAKRALRSLYSMVWSDLRLGVSIYRREALVEPLGAH
jgi:hypothetical protein